MNIYQENRMIGGNIPMVVPTAYTPPFHNYGEIEPELPVLIIIQNVISHQSFYKPWPEISPKLLYNQELIY